MINEIKNLYIVMTTTNSEELANNFANLLVTSNIAPCVQIDKIHSIYKWQGRITHEAEYRLHIKTTKPDAAEEFLLELHNYDTPEIITIKADLTNAKYMQWLMRFD